MSDGTTGWCERGEHSSCHGTMRAGRGYHWWCACRCHPEPRLTDVPPSAFDDAMAAIEQFHLDREALGGEPGWCSRRMEPCRPECPPCALNAALDGERDE